MNYTGKFSQLIIDSQAEREPHPKLGVGNRSEESCSFVATLYVEG